MRLIAFLILLFSLNANSQKLSSDRPDAIEIYKKIEKLNFLGSALYIAAHPDDENTRLISYLSKSLNANTAYLSMTRGDGGQNLIGTEIKEELGVLRTHELLQARATDGGSQFFTRAIDFGYSKHPDETFNIWNKEEVMSDIVWVIRNFKPDVIINRFDHRTPGKTHGHHTGSAMLSLEAFDQASDPDYYKSQLDEVDTWQTHRLFFNTSWWFYGGREKFAKADKSNLIKVDIGTYDPMRGSSISEIAVRARSKHLSQGFGSVPSRGSRDEWLEYIKGDPIADKDSGIFEGINTSWSRLTGGEKIGAKLESLLERFDFRNPVNKLNELCSIYKDISELEDSHWKQIKLKEITQIIEDVCGLYIEASSDQQRISHQDSLELTLELTNRTEAAIKLLSMKLIPFDQTIGEERNLEENVENKWFETVAITNELPYSSPYWLENEASMGMYDVTDRSLIGKALSPNRLKIKFNLTIEGQSLSIIKNVIHKYGDPAQGEVYQPLEIVPPVFVSLDKEVYLFADDKPQEVIVDLQTAGSDQEGIVKLDLPVGWKAVPAYYDFSIHQKGSLQKYSFMLTPVSNQFYGNIGVTARVGQEEFKRSVKTMDYDHVPYLTMTKPCKSKIVRIPLKKEVGKLAYIMGAGDKMPESLRDVGYDLDLLDLEEFNPEDLKQYDAIILGIRIYNVNDKIVLYQNMLFDYVKDGGTLVTQYNTSRRVKVDKIAPYHLKLSRDRVTDENAPVQITNPNHPVLNFPNKITEGDFENWIQERGLYFPNEWGPEFESVISINDKGESPKEGSLLIAKHGKGHYVYSGLSWFRELPAGVPGAYRLFANILALGQSSEQ